MGIERSRWRRISAEESFHKKQGQDLVIRMSQGTAHQRAMLQDAINRWWWPTLMMFGPPDEVSSNTPVLTRWGIKTRTNDELRQAYLNQIVPELQALGVSLPDPDLHYDEANASWISGPIDWDEFWRVIHGQGPCNRERLEARRKAHEEGAWVRTALQAYANQNQVVKQNPI